ncbi:MAG: hypothetical protein JF609_06545 [Verrucomicrobia bacterium]|nr:hypothetical protein [Verrucomicrobiota bacterium]
MSGQPTPEARQDYDALLNALMPFAEQMLKQHGEFFPFGAAVNLTGEVTAHATYDGNELPPSEEVIASLTKAFLSEAREGKIRAAGICYDGRIIQGDKKVDAVMMTMEHQSGNASKVCVPYTKGWFGKYNFGQMVAALEEPKIFVKA